VDAWAWSWARAQSWDRDAPKRVGKDERGSLDPPGASSSVVLADAAERTADGSPASEYATQQRLAQCRSVTLGHARLSEMSRWQPAGTGASRPILFLDDIGLDAGSREAGAGGRGGRSFRQGPQAKGFALRLLGLGGGSASSDCDNKLVQQLQRAAQPTAMESRSGEWTAAAARAIAAAWTATGGASAHPLHPHRTSDDAADGSDGEGDDDSSSAAAPPGWSIPEAGEGLPLRCVMPSLPGSASSADTPCGTGMGVVLGLMSGAGLLPRLVRGPAEELAAAGLGFRCAGLPEPVLPLRSRRRAYGPIRTLLSLPSPDAGVPERGHGQAPHPGLLADATLEWSTGAESESESASSR